MTRYVDDKYTKHYRATVGADFMAKEVMIDDKMVSLQVRATAILLEPQDLGYCWLGEIQESWWRVLPRLRLLRFGVRYHKP